jgi:glycosyltransferase involved in cell wall biosynthesis
MKVALFGNVCNNFYALAKSLRNNNLADAHLYLHDKVDIQNRPESDDPQLKNNYPGWIHMSELWDPFRFLKKRDRTFINELNKYDAVFLSDLGVMLAPFIKSKTIFYVTGGDLTRIPFPRRYMQELKGLKFWFIRQYISYMQRRGIRKCDMIITQPFYPFKSALDKLKVDPSRISKSYYPILIDTNIFQYVPNAIEEIEEVNRKKLKPFKFVFFHPSRLFITKKKYFEEMGVWKGNDNLFAGFAIFLKKYNIRDACIAMPERVHSPDIDLAKKIISELGIEDNVVWLCPPNNEGFSRNELMKYYSLSNLVGDEFATGWFGSIVVEGMACGKPTFCYVEESVMKQLYPSHPIISAKKPEAIAEQIARFYFDSELCQSHGIESRQWAVKYHSLTEGSKIYINNLKNDLKSVFQKAE